MSALEPVTAFILSTVLRSKAWTDALSHFLNHFATKNSNSSGLTLQFFYSRISESTWQILEILSVLVQAKTGNKAKVDASSLQNCLIGLISKLPEASQVEEDER